MATVLIGRRHRADFHADLRAVGLSSFTLVVDTQPNLLDAPGASSVALSAQCATCNLLDFLAQVENLDRYRGLSAVRGFFALLPEIARAEAAGDGDALLAVAARLRASGVYELTDRARPPRLSGAARIAVVGDDDGPGQVRDAARVADASGWVLLEPSREGPSRTAEQISDLARAGARRVLLGYYSHAAATERFSAFVESESFAERWHAMLLRSKNGGFAHFGLAMALPACATLQMGSNVALERLRARLDLQFRRMTDDASLMCPENVSGYGLTNDTRATLAGTHVARTSLAVRYGSVILAFR
jgi:hypothetical protein